MSDWNRIEEPVETVGGRDETVTHHPSFAQIGASRVSGAAYLAGSDFQHQHFVSVKIAASELHRNLGRDWWFAKAQPYIEVWLSEAQWATFVSSMNVGDGAACTVRFKDGKPVPRLPAPKERLPQAKGEVKEQLEEMFKEVEALKQKIEAMNLPKGKTSEILNGITTIQNKLNSSVPFYVKSFDEHMEKTVQKAKIEVNAYAQNMLVRTGLDALGVQPPIKALDDKS